MDDELELAAAFDEFLRSSSSAASSAGSAAPAAGDFDAAQSRPAKADVIRLLHEVFRSPASGPAATLDPAAAVNADSALETPQSIGRFKIERLLGSGAFGSVYLAHDPVLGRLVALKVIHRHLLNDQSVRRRVLREREVMARLQHPNVVPVWDAGEERDLLYIVSEYCPGPTLAQWLAERRRQAQATAKQVAKQSDDTARRADVSAAFCADPQQAARWILALADAVHHSHERGIIHRDLKPGNVLLEQRPVFSATAQRRKSGRKAALEADAPADVPSDKPADWSPRLSDFGLAKYFRLHQDETRTGLFVGSLEYASPEQVRGQIDAIGPGSDIYSLGVVLFELLTGTLPHAAESDYDLARKICEQDAAFSPPDRRRLPRDLQAITLRALQRNPEDRYRTAAELREDLQRYLSNQFVVARHAPISERCARWARQHPTVAALSVLCVLFASLLVTVLVVHNRQLEDYSEQLVEALVHAHVQRGEAHAQRHAAAEMQLRAEESEKLARAVGYHANMRLAFEAWEKSNWADARSILDRAAADAPALLGVEWHWLDRELNARYRRFPTLDNPASGLVYQPSRRAVITIGDAGRVQWWGLMSRSLLSEFHARPGAHALALSPDESLLALPFRKETDSSASSLQLWKVGREAPQELEQHFHPTTIESIEFSPDGQWLASGPRYEPVIVSNLDTGDAFAIPTRRRNRQLAFSPSGDRLAVVADNRRIEIHELSTRQCAAVLENFDTTITSHTWLPNREVLAVNTRGPGHIDLFSTLTGKRMHTFAAGVVGETMAASADGKHLALCSGEGTVCIQKIPYFKAVAAREPPRVQELDKPPIQILSGVITAATFVDKTELVAADEDGNLVWLSSTAHAFRRRLDSRGLWKNVRWESNERFSVFSEIGPAVSFGISSHGRRRLEMPVEAPLKSITSADGRLHAVYSAEGDVWMGEQLTAEPRLRTRVERGNAPGHFVLIRDAAFSPDGRFLYATGENNRLTAWHTADGSLAWQKTLTNSGVALAIDPATQRLFLGGDFETLKVWNAESGELIEEYSGGNGTAALTIDVRRRRLLSGHSDGTLRIHSLNEANKHSVHRGHFCTVTAVTQTPDGQTIITGDERGRIRLWQSDGQPYGVIYQSAMPDGRVEGFAWSPDGRHFAAVLCNAATASEVVFWENPQLDVAPGPVAAAAADEADSSL